MFDIKNFLIKISNLDIFYLIFLILIRIASEYLNPYLAQFNLLQLYLNRNTPTLRTSSAPWIPTHVNVFAIPRDDVFGRRNTHDSHLGILQVARTMTWTELALDRCRRLFVGQSANIALAVLINIPVRCRGIQEESLWCVLVTDGISFSLSWSRVCAKMCNALCWQISRAIC